MAEQNLPGEYENPYKFNAKELDPETELYYYGARYYNPRLSVWYGVDPLAVYNPIMETEFYGDGQHNGCVFFWGNLNPYIYTYQNPIRYIDPNGKQVEWPLAWQGFTSTTAATGGSIGGGALLGPAIVVGGIGYLAYKSHQAQQRFLENKARQENNTTLKEQKEAFLLENFPTAEQDNLIVRDYPAAISQKVSILNADHSNNDKKKVGNTEIGDIVQTPDSHSGNFNKRGDGTFSNRKTGEIWSKSHTQHSGVEEWKVGIGTNTPTKNNKITVSKEQRKVLKVNKSK